MKKSIFRIFLMVVLSTFAFASQLIAQSDTEFWFAAPENSFGGGSSTNRDNPIYIRVATFAQGATITVSQPARPGFVPMVQAIGAYSTYTFNLTSFLSVMENKPANTILDYGIKISSTTAITAYYEQASTSNPDIFTLKGRNALGTRFIIPSQLDYNNVDAFPTGGLDKLNSFVIVATENNTQVTITPAKSIVGRPAGVPFTITLNAGQTYSGTATSQLAAQHLLGSLITSNKPIAVTVNDDSVVLSGTAADLAGDQTIPSHVAGKDYVLVKGYLELTGSPKDRVYILADSNNTAISINGVFVTTLNALQHYNYAFGAENAIYLTASKPVVVFQLSGYNQQPAGAIIPPIQCTGSNEIVFTRSPVSASQFGLIIFTRTGYQASFTVTPNHFTILASDFLPVPGTAGQWQYARKGNMIGVNNNVAYRVSNSTGLFHLGVLYGNTSSDARFGFFSNFATVNLGPDRKICSGDSTLLDAGAGREAYLWNTGATTHSIWASTPGNYWVQVTENLCNLSDTINVGFHAYVPVNLGPDTSICSGSTITFSTAGSYVSYLWTPGNIITPTLTTGTAGTYKLTTTDNNSCSYSDTVILTVQPKPTPKPVNHN
ncbi:MAG: IgGFc-binding protein [Bacteroidales bacterium]|nr:IgGFc-binding protein [Bacteroidales bacterium]